MTNISGRVTIYSASRIGDILRIARERASQEERRTKRYVMDQLGITMSRLTNIEKGFSHPPFELAVEWCQIVEDDTALAKIKHIYGVGLPATDPRLLYSVPDQLINFIQQASQAIDAAKNLLHISTQMRPDDVIDEQLGNEMLKHAEEILDTKQASDCVLDAMQRNWHMSKDALTKNWIQEAIADRVIIPSVSHFEQIRKEQYFEDRARSFGRLEN